MKSRQETWDEEEVFHVGNPEHICCPSGEHERKRQLMACAPEMARMLLDAEGLVCMCGDTHVPDCPWLALMRKAGLRR